MADPHSHTISPTAYATGRVWLRNGLSHPALLPRRGRSVDVGFRALSGVVGVLGGGLSLEAMLLARHTGIDSLLHQAIEEGRVTQVIELAAGLSPRGWDCMRRYGDRLTYLETDLAPMVALKRGLLEQGGLLSERHRVVELDALQPDGPRSLEAVAATLDPKRGTAIITEGLMNYLAPRGANHLWRRMARTLSGFPQGLYLSDAYPTDENLSPAMLVFGALLQSFVRGRLHTHFSSVEQGERKLHEFGFRTVHFHATRDLPGSAAYAHRKGSERVRVIEAWA